MVMVRYEQSNFTKGELDPKTHARTDTVMYYKGAKSLYNCLVIPQGGVTGRWGTVYVDTSATNLRDAINGEVLKIGQSVYLIEFGPNVMYVYLENRLLVTTPIPTPYRREDIPGLSFTQIRNRLIISNTSNIRPQQVVNSAAGPIPVTSVFGVISLRVTTAPLTLNSICAFYFSGAAPTPVVGSKRTYLGRTYYAVVVAADRIEVYENPTDASTRNAPFGFVGATTGVSINFYRLFTISPSNFSNFPTYDFTGGYSTITFTPSATFGTVSAPMTITASADIFTPQHVGGIFNGNGGIMRITAFTSPTVINGYTVHDFVNINPIAGAVVKLTEPVWSDLRGWPRTVTTSENRLIFGGTELIPNGTWASVIEEFYNFDDSEKLADNAISWYPEDGNSNIINALTSYNSLLVHSDSTTYSTPTFSEITLTPDNFVLKMQGKDGVSPNVRPVAVDNQVIYIDKSGRNVKSLAWDTGQSKYEVINLSLESAHLIKNPIDAEIFTNPTFINGSLVLFINEDGTLTHLQSVRQEEIRAYSPAETKVTAADGTVTPSRFVKVVSSEDRLWFWVERTINGTTVINIEELNFDVKSDCCYIRGGILNQVTGLTALANCAVDVVRDGFVIKGLTVSAGGVLNIPGTFTTPARVVVGHPFKSRLIPMPIATIPGTPSSLYGKQHIREIRLNYYQTLGATIDGNEILTETLPVPFTNGLDLKSGISNPYTPGVGWDPAKSDILIEQANPLPFTILAIEYTEEV